MSTRVCDLRCVGQVASPRRAAGADWQRDGVHRFVPAGHSDYQGTRARGVALACVCSPPAPSITACGGCYTARHTVWCGPHRCRGGGLPCARGCAVPGRRAVFLVVAPPPPPHGPCQGLEIIGSDSVSASELADTFHFLDTHGIRPNISDVLPLEQVQGAMRKGGMLCVLGHAVWKAAAHSGPFAAAAAAAVATASIAASVAVARGLGAGVALRVSRRLSSQTSAHTLCSSPAVPRHHARRCKQRSGPCHSPGPCRGALSCSCTRDGSPAACSAGHGGMAAQTQSAWPCGGAAPPPLCVTRGASGPPEADGKAHTRGLDVVPELGRHVQPARGARTEGRAGMAKAREWWGSWRKSL